MRLKPADTYNLIAAALRGSKPGAPLRPSAGAERQTSASDGAYLQWEHDVRALAHALRSANPMFKHDLFFKLCGYTDEN